MRSFLTANPFAEMVLLAIVSATKLKPATLLFITLRFDDRVFSNFYRATRCRLVSVRPS